MNHTKCYANLLRPCSAGTLCDPDGELFIKPCTQQEVDFYNSAADEHPDFADIMPVFMGTLTLNDATDIADINEQLPVVADHIPQHLKEEVVKMAHSLHPEPPSEPETTPDNVTWKPNKDRKIATDTALVLENAAYGYKQPNIMDIKLGTRLWADDAPQEKKNRFDKIAAETTHKDLGFRIAGMRVFRGSHDKAELDQEDYRIYDKDWGRFTVNAENVVDSLRKFIFNEAAKVDLEHGKAVAQAFKRDLEHVRDVLEQEESRMYSASLLFVFEGDGEALKVAVEESNETVTQKEKEDETRANIRVDSGIDLGPDGEMVTGAVMNGQMVLAADVDEDDESDLVNLPRIYGLKLIDFAHAAWAPGEGPDENVLKGVRSLIEIFDELSQ